MTSILDPAALTLEGRLLPSGVPNTPTQGGDSIETAQCGLHFPRMIYGRSERIAGVETGSVRSADNWAQGAHDSEKVFGGSS